MIVFSARSDVTALAALVAQAGPGPARYRRALSVALSLADEAVAEPMARNMVRTLLRMPGMAERLREHLSQTPPAEVRISSQDASAAVEAACPSPTQAGGLTSLQQQLEDAERRLACADRIDDWRRREIEMGYAEYAVEGLRRMVEEEARA